MSAPATHWAHSVTVGSASRKLILLLLADRHNADTGQCNPKIAKIAEAAELSKRMVSEHLRVLEEDGFIRRLPEERANGSRTTNQYELLMGGHEAHFMGGMRSTSSPELELEPKTVSDGADARTITAKFVDLNREQGVEPARNEIGFVARQVATLLKEGFAPDVVERGVALLVDRGLNAATLPSLMRDAQRAARAYELAHRNPYPELRTLEDEDEDDRVYPEWTP